jgi:hypothetical protein
VLLELPADTSLLPTPRATDGTKGGPNQRGSSGDLMLPSAVMLFPTPTTQDGANTGGASQYDRNTPPLNAMVTTLLPTPAVNDMGEGKTVEDWDAWTDRQREAHGNGNGHGKSLAIESLRLLPTHRSAANRTSRSAATRRDSMSGPSLEQATEIAAGRLPREFTSWEELPESWQPAPDAETPSSTTTREGSAPAPAEAPAPTPSSGGQTMLLLPTPVAKDADGARNSTSTKPAGSTARPGDTLTDWAWKRDGWSGDRTSPPSDAGSTS